jgi:nucleoside-diphosphate-sugar epimerase
VQLQGKLALVTGANGFLGSRVGYGLLRAGVRVRAMVRRPADYPELAAAGMEVVPGDVTDAAAVQAAVSGVQLVVHCAAVPGPDHATSLRVNGEGTRNVVEAALAAGCERFLHVSTVAVYDQTGQDVVGEDFPLKTKGNPYEEGKVAAEQAVRDGMARGLQAVIIRPPAILGAHPTSTWCTKIAQAVQAGRWRLVGDGSNTFSYVHVENLVAAMLTALVSEAAVGQVYNIIDGHTTWGAYVEQFRQWLGADLLPSIPAEEAPSSMNWYGRYLGDKAVAELGYVPRHTYAEAMQETEAYLRERGIIA